MAMLGRIKLKDICPTHPFAGTAIVFGTRPPKPTPQTPPETALPSSPDDPNHKSGK
jgi:hypothetical protein